MKNTVKDQPTVLVKKKRRVRQLEIAQTSKQTTAPVVPRTQLSLKSKAEKKDRPEPTPKRRPMHEILDILENAFPNSFGKKYHPLKMGIHKDVTCSSVRNQLSYSECKRGLSARMNSVRYLEACKSGAVRVDLEGKPCGEVSAEHAAYAAEQLEKRLKTKGARLR